MSDGNYISGKTWGMFLYESYGMIANDTTLQASMDVVGKRL